MGRAECQKRNMGLWNFCACLQDSHMFVMGMQIKFSSQYILKINISRRFQITSRQT